MSAKRLVPGSQLRPGVQYIYAGADARGRALFHESVGSKGRRQYARRPSFDEVKSKVLKEVRDRAR